MTYREFADLSIIHTDNLSFFAGAETKAWDEIHQKEDDA